MSKTYHIHSYHLHLEGLVQGVGFRPFVYRLAREMALNGWVSNGPDGVHIEINADADTFAVFGGGCERKSRTLPG